MRASPFTGWRCGACGCAHIGEPSLQFCRGGWARRFWGLCTKAAPKGAHIHIHCLYCGASETSAAPAAPKAFREPR